MKDYKRYMVTAALPYANGPVHIGHLAGVYVPADIYARYLRMKDEDVKFVCGSDEHGVPITIKARNEGVNPQNVVDKYHQIIKDAFERFGMTFDIYSRTTSETHRKTASEIFKTLHDKGEFIEKTTRQYYDEETKQFLADRYIKGNCPNCNHDHAFGDQCENCGSSLSPTELINPVSLLSGAKPVLKETKHWYLPLDKYESFLRKWILEENKHWKPNVYGQCKSWLDEGLKPRAVSRDLDWGIPVPVENAEGKVLYVWFDAPIGYISATKDATPDWEKYWKSDDTKLVHFIGKDNIVFHCIIFPSILKNEGSYILPENVPANEFLNLEGDKISTSRNWAVWLHEYLEEFPGKEDSLRYSLCANAPETKDNDFTWKDFQARNNNELVAILGNFVNRAIVLTHKYFNGKIPEVPILPEEDEQILDQVKDIRKNIEYSLDNFRFREACQEAMNLARLGNKYLADTEPWKLIKNNEDRVKEIMYTALQITANLTIIMEPFLPFTTEKMRKILNFDQQKWEKLGEKDLLPSGHEINKAELLFEKIEDEVIEQQKNKLLEARRKNEQALAKANPAKEVINFEDFTKVDIRVGTILEAEKVPKTKKLIKLLIDTGIDKRTVVSGIAEFYQPDDIIGKQVCVLVNLAPRNLKGIESQGMVLLAEDSEGRLTFVSPESKIQNGAEVK